MPVISEKNLRIVIETVSSVAWVSPSEVKKFIEISDRYDPLGIALAIRVFASRFWHDTNYREQKLNSIAEVLENYAKENHENTSLLSDHNLFWIRNLLKSITGFTDKDINDGFNRDSKAAALSIRMIASQYLDDIHKHKKLIAMAIDLETYSKNKNSLSTSEHSDVDIDKIKKLVDPVNIINNDQD